MGHEYINLMRLLVYLPLKIYTIVYFFFISTSQFYLIDTITIYVYHMINVLMELIGLHDNSFSSMIRSVYLHIILYNSCVINYFSHESDTLPHFQPCLPCPTSSHASFSPHDATQLPSL